MSDLLSGNSRKTHRCWNAKNNCDWARLSVCVQKYVCTSRLVATGSVLGYCDTDWNCGQQNPVFSTPSSPPPPPPSYPPLISCISGGCVFWELVYICSLGVRCGTCEPHETQLTLLILPVLENSGSELVLFIDVVNSSIIILLKGPSWRGACWSTEGLYLPEHCVFLTSVTFYPHQSIHGQLKHLFNIVTIPFNIILLCLVPGKEV
jgi:hypothetical protein